MTQCKIKVRLGRTEPYKQEIIVAKKKKKYIQLKKSNAKKFKYKNTDFFKK